MEELAQYSPDLFIVYTGHNEFLEERTYRNVRQQSNWLRIVNGTLSRTRTFSALQRLIFPPTQPLARQRDGDSADPSVTKSGDTIAQLDKEVRTRLDNGVGPDAYLRDDALSVQVEEHFRFNLQRMSEIATRCGARIMFVTPASNLSDCSPFKSLPSTADPQRDADRHRQWQSLVDQANRAASQGSDVAAEQLLQQAVKIDPREAATQYQLGRTLLRLHRHDEARAAFKAARDEDVCPLRARRNFVQAVRDVAAAVGAPLN